MIPDHISSPTSDFEKTNTFHVIPLAPLRVS